MNKRWAPKHYVRTYVSKFASVRGTGGGESYRYKLVYARGEMWNRWESVATTRDYDGKLKDKGARTDGEMVEKLKEDHIFREFKYIVHIVGRRLRNIRVGCRRA